MVRNLWVGVGIALLVASCGSGGSVTEPSTTAATTITIGPGTTSLVSSSTTTTVAELSTTTSITATTTMTTPPFGSTAWIDTKFTVSADPSLGFGADYTVGEPRQAQTVVGGEPTGLWIWEATYEMPRIIAIGQGPSPYLRTLSEGSDETTTTTAPQDPTVVHEVMLWSVSGGGLGVWTIRDMLPLPMTSGFVAAHDVYGDCFDDTSDRGRRVLGWIDPDDWNIQVDDEGNWIGASDIRPLLAFDTGVGGRLEQLEPETVTCRILY